MRQERSKILQMLEDGQVTADEATVLLKTRQVDRAAPVAAAPPNGPSASAADSFQLGDWIRRILAVAVKQTVAETLEWQIDSAAVQAIAVKTANGSIQYSGADQPTIAIHARKIVRAPDVASAEAFAQQVHIHSEVIDGMLHLYPEHPKPPRHVSVEVTFIITGPRAINITAQSTNGSVQVENIEGMVQAHSTNGGVKIAAITGRVIAQNTNGSIRATALTLRDANEFTSHNGTVTVDIVSGQPSLTANTVNGSIRLSLPPDYAGQLTASTHNGQVRTNFPIKATQSSRTRLIGQIGAGGDAQVALGSHNGSVQCNMAEIDQRQVADS